METGGNKNHEQQPSTMSEIGSFFWDLFKIFLVALVIIIPFRIFVAEPFVVSGSSMVPNFHNRDYLIVDRLSYRSHAPQRGDVVVLKYPKDTSQYFIKRIIGLPGETVQFEGGHVVIINSSHPQGWILNEPYLQSQVETIGRRDPLTLREGEYYVLGDNRTASSDSRVWGVLPADDIVGRAWLRVFPVGSFSVVKTPTYNQ